MLIAKALTFALALQAVQRHVADRTQISRLALEGDCN